MTLTDRPHRYTDRPHRTTRSAVAVPPRIAPVSVDVLTVLAVARFLHTDGHLVDPSGADLAALQRALDAALTAYVLARRPA